MDTGRLEAFTDGVLAVVITIMVLELKPPHMPTWHALQHVWPVLLSYVLSFVYIGIYWNNHHHMMRATSRISGRVLWANLHLLFWLSLIPFTTAWMSENRFALVPVVVYGAVLLLAALAWPLLQREIVACNGGRGSAIAAALGGDVKGKLSIGLYVAAIVLAFVGPWLSCVLYAVVAAMWFVPDRRFEKVVTR
ncbi:MAG TPA: TMEM175 family protein [Rhodanobacteraceae bacterium]|nr:TMEM175 family protein [Rhodanobacteraceae bacterium]